MSEKEEDLATLREMVREGERVLDVQADSFRQLDGKSQQSIALGLASLGGALALLTFSVEKLGAAFDKTAWMAFAASGLLNLGALALFIDADIGFRPTKGRQAVVPALFWLAEKSMQEDWTLEEHLLSVLREFPRCYRLNQQVIEGKVSKRRIGLQLLLLALTLDAIAFLYIVSKLVVW